MYCMSRDDIRLMFKFNNVTRFSTYISKENTGLVHAIMRQIGPSLLSPDQPNLSPPLYAYSVGGGGGGNYLRSIIARGALSKILLNIFKRSLLLSSQAHSC